MQHRSFRVHPDRFDYWIEALGDTLAAKIPTRSTSATPAALFQALVAEAAELGVLGDHGRTALSAVACDNDPTRSGIVVMVDRTDRNPRIATTWIELHAPAAGCSDAHAAMSYLALVCSEANALHYPEPTAPQLSPAHVFELAADLHDAQRSGEPLTQHYETAEHYGITADQLTRAARTLDLLAIEDFPAWIRQQYLIDGSLRGYLPANPADLTTWTLAQLADHHYTAARV